jgi:Ca2+-binding EF-hand superfamily protein
VKGSDQWWTDGQPFICGSYKDGYREVSEAHVKQEFDRWATDGKFGKQGLAKLAAFMGEPLTTLTSHRRLDRAWATLDTQGTGKVTFAQFERWHRSNRPTSAKDREHQAAFLFKQLDVDNSNSLSLEEMTALLKTMGARTKGRTGRRDLAAAFSEMDADGSGEVGLDEFVAWHNRQHPSTPEHVREKVRYYFDRLDADGGGTLDAEEVSRLAVVLGDHLKSFFSHAKLDAAFAEMDRDGDGEVTVEEFAAWHERTHPEMYA